MRGSREREGQQSGRREKCELADAASGASLFALELSLVHYVPRTRREMDHHLKKYPQRHTTTHEFVNAARNL
jgi:hypothetical protein